MTIHSIYLLLFFVGILLSFPTLAEINLPTPTVVSIENTAYANPKTVEEKRNAGKFIFVQYTKDYNEQFRKDNQFNNDIIGAATLTDVLKKIDELNETELDQPMATHIKNAKANYDMIAQHIYAQEHQAMNQGGSVDNIKAENSAVSSRFRGLEIFFAVIVVVLASLLYKKTFKILDKTNK